MRTHLPLLFKLYFFICVLSLSSNSFSQNIDLSKPVGTTEGKAGVSPTGGVNYVIPIEVLKGTNGMEPKINLVYNSQGGEGIAGFGWNLSALSLISRQGKRQYYNGINTPVTYTNDNDAFLLDGQRLFPVSGNNGDNGAVYGTENESFSKIESFGGSNTNGPDWFRVTTKDGLVLEYGTDPLSKLYTDYWQNVMLWLLKRVRDKSGNYYEYTYSMNTTDRNFALTEINYTGNINTGQPAYNKIEFTYNTLPNWQNRKIFEGGATIISPYLLNQINIKNQNGIIVKSYQCSYTTIRNQSFLSSFSETGSDGTVLNPLTFQYGSNTYASDVSVSSTFTGFNSNSTYVTYAGDVTGEGKQNLIAAKFYYDNSGVPHFTTYDVLNNLNNGSASPAYTYYINQSGATQVQGSNNGYYNFLTYDYDGDSKQDVLMISNSTSGSTRYFNGIKINYSRRYNWGPGYQTVDYPQIPYDYYYGSYYYIYNQGTYYIPGDFDGDGAQDYILILGLSGSNYFKAFFSSPAKNIINQEILSFGVGGNSSDPFYATTVASTPDVMPVDFDGDGKMEILVQKPGASYILSVFPISATTGYSYAASVSYTFSDILQGYRVFPGDFNGDGKTDLLVRTSPNNPYASWNMLYSTGYSFRSYPFVYQNRIYLDGDNGGSAHHLVLADFNGDGKTDIWHSMDLTTTTSRHAMYISNGVPLDYNNSTTAFTIYTYGYNAGINRGQTVPSVIGDLNFDGKPDIFSINGSNAKIIYPRPDKEENLMVSTTNGLGAQTQFSYNKGYNRSALYDYDDINAPLGQGVNGNPYAVLKTPMYVANYLMEPNGLGYYNYTSFQYEDAMFHPYRGFLGFKKVTSFNYSTYINSTTYSELNTTFFAPYTYKTTTDYYGTLLTETNTTNNFVRINPGNYYDKRYANLPPNGNNFNYVNGSGTEASYTYDSYGNITNSTTNIGSFSGTTITPTETVTSATSYVSANTPFPALPSATTITKTRINQSSVNKVTSYTYNGTGLTASVTDFDGTAIATTSNYSYDNFGNVNSQTISAPNTLTPVFTSTYDNFGRYLISKSLTGSGVTKTETYSYDLLNDEVASVTSSDGLITTYTHDGFGRVTQTGLPDGNIIISSIDWDTYNGRYSKTSYRYSDYGKWNREYFDILNRPVKEQHNGFYGALIESSTEYNDRGLIYKKVQPHSWGEPTVEVTHYYDYLGRLSSVSNSNTTTNYSYSLGSGGLLTATATNGASQSTSKTTDASGKVVSSNDNGGQLNFTYDSWGNQQEVKFGNTSLIVNTYDNYGRQTSLTDKNAGTITYQYNALGKIIQQTDAKNNTHTFNYDAFGRVLTKTGPAGTTTYTYYYDPSTGKCNDNISSITGFSGDIKNYQYDNLQRLITETTSFQGQVFIKSMGYDAAGNLATTTYPSGVTINDAYDANGFLTQTSMTYNGNTQTLFSANAMNGKGVYTSYNYGNGLSSTVDYDLVNGVPTRYYTPGIQDLNFSFDNNTGNLLSRYDGIKNLTETFTYDDLNRLTSSTVNNTQQFAITYDGSTNNSLGNIQSKSDIGNYRYDQQKINAVRFITTNSGVPANPPNVISLNTQTITYTPFLKTATISENGYQLAYNYGEDEQRIKSVLTQNGNTLETKYYQGAYEVQTKNGITSEIHFVSAGNGSCAIIVKQGGQVTPYFVYTDYLGSILTLTDINGNIVAEQNFDAWGRYRNPNGWTYNNLPARPDWLYRGFTGQEHLNEFTLINMNGRMYDPVTGRMLSPDNNVPLPWNTQGYNRYGYANNNPLIYRDPDGEFIHLIIGAIIGGIVNLVSSALHGNIHSFWDGLKSFGIGAVQGALGAAIGYGGFGWGAASRAFSAGFFSTSCILGSIATGIGSSFLPAIPIGNNFSISPSFAFGTHGLSTGLSANYHSGNFSLGVGFSNDGTNSHVSYGGGYDDGKFGISYYRNEFSGEHKQTTGQWGVHLNRISITFEEDHKYWTFMENKDRWRTTGIGIGYNMKDGSQIYAGMRFMTGERDGLNPEHPGYWKEKDIAREGLFYAGYKNSRGLSYSAGVDWEHGRAQVMDFIHGKITHDPLFENLESQYPAKGFFRYGNYNPFTYYW